ncbi:MAG TPA: hypothetical protein VMS98_08405 [Thermoanaerobaculia bacterium]|nr:hypothetical protein [Thermoanaerobaculia bacterium]
MSEPQSVRWFKVYVAVLSALYLLIVIAGAIVIAMNLSERDGLIAGIIMTLAGLLFLAIYAAGLFLPPRPWAWIYALVLIAGGFTSCLTLPFSIVLLVQFLQPETKTYFGRPI